jgi:nucleoside-diphosphate-sugar epimerase
MKVLITGGAGFLGSHLADAFLDRGDEVFVIDEGPATKIQHRLGHEKLHFANDSILNEALLEELVARVDLVYHLAAVVGVEHYVVDPYRVLNVNVSGTQTVLRLACKHGRRVVFASTSEVYGRNPKVPWREDDDRVLGSTSVDRWCYSTSKAVGEHFCLAYAKRGLPVAILRYFNVYGPRLDGMGVSRVVSIFLKQALRGEPLTVVGDGSQTRCFTYESDAIAATIVAGVRPEAVGGVFNIGCDVEVSIRTLAERIIHLSGSTSKIVCVSPETVYGRSYEDILRRVPDIQRMQEILGITPKVRLDDGLRETIESFRKEEAGRGRLP